MLRIATRSMACLFVLGMVVLPPAAGLDTATRLVSPVMEWTAADLERFDEAWLHVKFVEGSNVVTDGIAFGDEPPVGSALDLTAVNACLAAEDVQIVRRTFAHSRALLREWKARGEMRSRETGPDLSLWFDVRVGGGRDAVARLVNELNACPHVEIAHPVAIPEPAGFFETSDDAYRNASASGGERLPTPDFSNQQGYLYDTPLGLDAPAAWAEPGGKGAEVKFVDVELCWTVDHEDFAGSGPFYIGGAGMNPSYEYHGTPVLGEVIGQHNGYGVSGFAPEVEFGVVAVTLGEWPYVPHYFQEAVDQLDAGDVWLIELQMYPSGFDATPMEWLQVNYDVIWTSSWSLGIICIEPAANGSQDLDDPAWGGIFDRNQRDSGAIMVAAGLPYSLTAEWFTNYGSRIDVHAWGSAIVSTGGGDLYSGGTPQTRYTGSFGGTSGASPMVAGSVAALQGIVKANQPEPYTPLEMRTLLKETGTPHVDPDQEIGPRPNLAAAVAELPLFSSIEESRQPVSRWIQFANPYRPSSEMRLLFPLGGEITASTGSAGIAGSAGNAGYAGIAGNGAARLAVFDAGGRHLRTLWSGPATADPPSLMWDGTDRRGRSVPGGIYYLQFQSPDVAKQARLVVVR